MTPVASINARSYKSSKTNTRNSTNLKSNDDNNGAGSLSIGSGPSISSNSTHTTSTSTTAATTQSQPSIVKLSPAPSSTGSARTSSPVVNVTIMKKYRDEPSTSRTPDMPQTFGSVPTAGGLKFAFEEQQHQLPPAGLVINTNTHNALKESPPSSPGSEASARKRRKPTPQVSPHDYKEKETKVLQNGAVAPTHHMLGNQLNPNSSVAKNMVETLNMEIEAHSLYTHEPVANLVGPQYPGRKDSVSLDATDIFDTLLLNNIIYKFQSKQSSTTSSTTTSSGPASLTSMLSGASSSNGTPQSLEQLLERQWEQGSQFLMEQAQHFDSKF